MPDWLSIYEPALVNTIGHCAGGLIFGILLYFFFIDWRRTREQRRRLPVVAATLALLWNVTSLIALSNGPKPRALADVTATVGFSFLSLLPAVILHISLGARRRALWISGYFVSFTASVLHMGDLVTGAVRFHYAALLLVTLGFTGLTVISILLGLRDTNRGAGSRLVCAMALFLFAISFIHFGADHSQHVWLGEIAFHHAGIPLALLVILQDYRFLLLDVFLRFLVKASLAAVALLLAIKILQTPDLMLKLQNPFVAGVLFVSTCLLLTLFVFVQNRTQAFLTKAIFLRTNIYEALRELHRLAQTSTNEKDYISSAAETIAKFLRTSRFDVIAELPGAEQYPPAPVVIVENSRWSVPSWVNAILALRFAGGDARYIFLGAREGRRRYMSEDCAALTRLGATVVEHVEQLRNTQMQQLMSQAELKALQAQINPHFLFNSLNTLYGTIDRSNAKARQLVLNLAEVFRYLLRSDRNLIEVEEELRIVRAYLAIEELRLGSKLRAELIIDDSVLHAMVPMLSIQPLVENAVKHGVARSMNNGFVRLTIKATANVISVEVCNSGECDLHNMTLASNGVGLANIRRRLALCYGEHTHFEADSRNGVTTVGFRLPLCYGEQTPSETKTRDYVATVGFQLPPPPRPSSGLGVA